VVLLALATTVHAEPLPAYDLDYTADAGCPERAVFVAWVEAQLHDARETTAGSRVKAVVELRHANGATAHLELTRQDGARSTRELGGESCEAAAQGLAFVLAYALGGGDPLDAPLPETTPAPTQPLVVAPAPSSEVPVAVRVPVATPVPKPAFERVAGSAPRWRFGLGAQLGVRFGLGPVWTPVEVGWFELRRRQVGLAPAVRVALLHGQPIRRIERFGETELSWSAARLEGCPAQLRLLDPLRLLPCLAVHLGRIRAQGTPSGSAGNGKRVSELWADAAAALRLELTLWRLLELEIQGDVLVPFTQYTFAFDNPDTSVYQVPRVAFAGSAGVGVHFP
jgi:hypothetical protein